MIKLFEEVLNSCPRTSRRKLVNHIIVIGGLVLENIEERIGKELKQNASVFKLQSRDFKVYHYHRAYNASWDATRNYVNANYK